MKRTNKENIDYLMVDEPFGILTRPALELYMSNWKRKSKIYIVDFNGIHKLNNQLGYDAVNNMIRGCIADFNHSVKAISLTWGRVFSGDEIAILDTYYYPNLMKDFSEVCQKQNLGFKWMEGEIQLGKRPAEYIKELNDLSQKLKNSQYARML